MVTSFPLDYMHLVCLGFCKRLLHLWRSGPIAGNIRLPSIGLRRISDRLDNIRPYMPCEFQRKCRTLDQFERWKATEFRQFLLYLGPVVLRGILDEQKYENFLNFSICFYLLCHPLRASNYVEFVGEMINGLLNQYAALYGENELVYNTHSISHIWEDVKLRGPLDRYSAFPFESYMGKLRRMVRSSNMPASQILRRIMERLDAGCNDAPSTCADTISIMTRSINSKKLIQHDRLLVTDERPENAVIANGQPALIVQSEGNMVQIQLFDTNTEFFTRCVSSTDIGIYECSLPSKLQWIPSSNLDCKCVAMPYKDKLVFYPLLHTWV